LLVNSAFPFGLLVQWDEPSVFSPLPSNMHHWLLDTGSLTERLQANCENFTVEVLGQHQVELENAEKRALPNHAQSQWQVREVILHGDGKPWVFARSVLPQRLCESTWANLGNQPLGQRIFNDSRFVRSGFEIGVLTAHPVTGESFATVDAKCKRWARRSIFSIEEHELLVAEAFLPDCPCYQVSQC
jgi:chorismate--pyruvate lyase